MTTGAHRDLTLAEARQRFVAETGNEDLRALVVPKDGSPPFRLRTDTSIEAQLADVGQRVLSTFLS